MYLDVKYGFGPVIKFDVELLAPRQGPGQRALPQDEDDSAMGASGGQSQEESYTFSYSDPPPAYEEYDMYPSSTDALLKKWMGEKNNDGTLMKGKTLVQM